MASSFGAATIHVLRDDATGQVPRASRQRNYVQIDVPNADDHVTQLLGGRRASVTFLLWLTEAEYTALDALAHTAATLTLNGVSQGSYVLLDLREEVSDFAGDVLFRATFEAVA